MPAPKEKISTDTIIYNSLEYIFGNKFCYLNPNIITLSRLPLIYLLYQNLIHDGKITTALVLQIFILITDCLDGVIARTCNKTSTFGGILDILVDTLLYIVLYYFVIIRLPTIIPNKIISKSNIYFLGLLAILHRCYHTWKEICNIKKTGEFIYNNKFHEFLNDNSLVVILTSTFIIKKYL